MRWDDCCKITRMKVRAYESGSRSVFCARWQTACNGEVKIWEWLAACNKEVMTSPESNRTIYVLTCWMCESVFKCLLAQTCIFHHAEMYDWASVWVSSPAQEWMSAISPTGSSALCKNSHIYTALSVWRFHICTLRANKRTNDKKQTQTQWIPLIETVRHGWELLKRHLKKTVNKGLGIFCHLLFPESFHLYEEGENSCFNT